jgi:hypothetical protein
LTFLQHQALTQSQGVQQRFWSNVGQPVAVVDQAGAAQAYRLDRVVRAVAVVLIVFEFLERAICLHQ